MADKDVNIHVRAKDADQAKRDIDGVGASTENLGKKTEQAGRKSEQAGRKTEQAGKKARTTAGGMGVLGKAVGAVTGYLAGMVTVAGLFAFFKKWYDWIKAITGANKELVESTKDLDRAAKALASQANVMGTEQGMEAARKQILRVAEAGDTTVGVAEGVLVAAHSAFGTSGQLLAPEQEEIAGIVAGFAQRKDISTGGTNQLLKLLAAMGVQNADEAMQRIQQLSTVQQASKAKTFEEFAGGAIKAMVPMLAQAASPEFALSSYASSLDVNATADLAAEKTRQMSALLQNPKILEAMGADKGMSEMDIRDMPFDQRAMMFSGWVSTKAATGAGQKQLLSAGLSAEQLNVASTLYAAKQLERRAMFSGLAEGATAEQFEEQAEGYSTTTQGRIEALRSQAERTAASATPDMRVGQAWIDDAEAQWKIMEGKGETPVFQTEGAAKRQMIRDLVRRPFFQRMLTLPESPEKEAVHRILERNPVLKGKPFRIAEIGEVDRLLREAEEKYSGRLNELQGVGTPDFEIVPPRDVRAEPEAEPEITPPPESAGNPEEFRKMYPSPEDWGKSRKMYPSPEEWAKFEEAYPEVMAEAIVRGKPGAKTKQYPWVDNLFERFVGPLEAEPERTPPPEPVAVEAEPETTPPPEPVAVEAQGQSVSYNDYSEYYDYSVNVNPVAGNREDRLIGPRYDQNA